MKLLQPVMPLITGNPIGRTILLAQFSAKPWKLDGDVALQKMRSFASSPSSDEALQSLVTAPAQAGMPARTATSPIVISWGKPDWVCLPRQGPRGARCFPDARLVWFEACGHFPQWDSPQESPPRARHGRASVAGRRRGLTRRARCGRPRFASDARLSVLVELGHGELDEVFPCPSTTMIRGMRTGAR